MSYANRTVLVVDDSSIMRKAEAFLPKPFDQRALKAVIEKVLA